MRLAVKTKNSLLVAIAGRIQNARALAQAAELRFDENPSTGALELWLQAEHIYHQLLTDITVLNDADADLIEPDFTALEKDLWRLATSQGNDLLTGSPSD